MTVSIQSYKYICGPMTGLPEYNYPAFKMVTARLRSAGHLVVCPTEVNSPDDGGNWKVWTAKAISKLLGCDTIVYLDGWAQSKGATLEMLIAQSLGFDFLRADITERGVYLYPIKPAATVIVGAFLANHLPAMKVRT